MSVYVKMTEEGVARYWAQRNGMAIIDWQTLQRMVELMPAGVLTFNAALSTYELTPAELGRMNATKVEMRK